VAKREPRSQPYGPLRPCATGCDRFLANWIEAGTRSLAHSHSFPRLRRCGGTRRSMWDSEASFAVPVAKTKSPTQYCVGNRIQS
jgi:hypothetical protein